MLKNPRHDVLMIVLTATNRVRHYI